METEPTTTVTSINNPNAVFVKRDLHEELVRIDTALVAEEKAKAEVVSAHNKRIKKLKAERNDVLDELRDDSGQMVLGEDVTRDEAAYLANEGEYDDEADDVDGEE